MSRRTLVIFTLLCTLATFAHVTPCVAASYPFSDSFEAGLTGWVADAPWGLTTAYYSSPAHSVTDSPLAAYGNNVDASLAMASSLDLSAAVHPAIAFLQRYEIEDEFDTASVEVSVDGGASWSSVLSSYTGSQTDWAREQLDLSPYAGETDFRVRFRLVTDDSVFEDGWYIDDVVVGEAPAVVSVDPPEVLSSSSVRVTWSPSSDPDFAAYRLLRCSGSSLDWHTATVVAEIQDVSQTTVTDVTVSPKTSYRYAVMVLAASGLHSLSNEVIVSTPSGVTYPFLDDAEGSGSTWSPEGTWSLSDEAAFGGQRSWTDSPGGDYDNGIAGQSLVLVNAIDLSTAVDPVLSFEHEWEFAAGDLGSVEVSADGGATWTGLAVYMAGSSEGWRQARFDLGAFSGAPQVLIRFRISTNASDTADGWHLDDISVAESPDMVGPPLLDDVTAHSIRLSWAPSVDPTFSHYVVFRDSTDAVGINSPIVAIVPNRLTSTLTDTGLTYGEEYFYRVYAVNSYGTYSPDTPIAGSATTVGSRLPFLDDFEGSIEAWETTGDWSTTDEDSHGGWRSLTDSPGTVSGDSSSSASIMLDLSGSSWPVLRFWDRSALDSKTDVHVAIGNYSNTWLDLLTFTGTSDWSQKSLDLSPWKDRGEIRIEFGLDPTWSSAPRDDGWHIDDVSVADNIASTTPPFEDGAESGFESWLAATWSLSSENPHGGSYSFQHPSPGIESSDMGGSLELASELDLSGMINPQLAFSARGLLGNRSMEVRVSVDGGLHWSLLPDAKVTGDHTEWTRFQGSLEAYRQPGVRIKFMAPIVRPTERNEVFLDDIVIRDMPSDTVVLGPPIPHPHSIDFSWSQSSLGAEFGHYEVHRSEHPGVSIDDPLGCSSASITATSCSDTGVSIATNYYYRVFTVDIHGIAVPSNEVLATTLPHTLPFSDPMEDLANWGATGTWGPDDGSYHGGSHSISDSPGGSYPSGSSESYIVTSLDLSGSSWPILRFWDRYSFAETVDFGRLEISTDGETWTSIYSVGGTQDAWQEHAIDLSPWKASENVRLRYMVETTYSAVDDGWYIDDVAVADHSAELSLPFSDDLESGAGNWLASTWVTSATDPHSGALCLRSASDTAYVGGSENNLELAGSLDLSGATDPQLTYWAEGDIWYADRFVAQVSTDGGLTWIDLPGTELVRPWSGAWTRFQISLASFLAPGLRLRFHRGGLDDNNTSRLLALDDIMVTEGFQGVTLDQPVSGFRTVGLSWSQSTLGTGFLRYEVHRATHPGVSTSDNLVYSTGDIAVTSTVDSGLDMGTTYYYVVAVFDSTGAAALSNEVSAATDVLHLPVSDPMENLDNWLATGSWGPDSQNPHGGSSSLTDSPGAICPRDSDTHILTEVSLAGSIFPVLRFWDRYGFSRSTNRGYLEVSLDGSEWTTLYGVTGTRLGWSERELDLSPWRLSDHVYLRFRVDTGYSNQDDDGWYVDDLSITDIASSPVPLPLIDGGESGDALWLVGGWSLSQLSAHNGSFAFSSSYGGGDRFLVLTRAIDLTDGGSPMLSVWCQRTPDASGTFSVEASSDGGLTWDSLPDLLPSDVSEAWSRHQFSLADYVGTSLRVRLRAHQGYSVTAAGFFVDDVIVAQALEASTLSQPDQITTSSMRLSWTGVDNPGFAAYELYRSLNSEFSSSSTELVERITDPSTTSVVDSDLKPGVTYFYRVEAVDQDGVISRSNTVSGTTLSLSLPFFDNFETDSGAWWLSGGWGFKIAGGIGGSTCFSRAPTGYDADGTSWALTSVDLSGAKWPVLEFSDRANVSYELGYVEVSSDQGDTWTPLSSVFFRPDDGWADHRFDLSPWKGNENVWILFQMQPYFYGYLGPTEIWDIDNLSVQENQAQTETPHYPFFEGAETGGSWWLPGPWGVTAADDCFRGQQCFLVPAEGSRAWDTSARLVWAGEIDLSGAIDPLLAFWIKGQVGNTCEGPKRFVAQVSTDDGLSWQDLPEFYLGSYFTSDWVQLRGSLSGYLVKHLRIRLVLEGTGRGGELFVDNIGVGPDQPTAPTLLAPEDGADVDEAQPLLSVTNAFDYQTDPLSYEFQVFDDAALTHLVAQGSVEEGEGTTEWKTTPELTTGAQYWWRCRAVDDLAHASPWSTSATFYLGVNNRPPQSPVPVAPANGTQFTDLLGRLSWLRSEDPDSALGDHVVSYRVQVDDDPAFASPEIDQPGIPASGAKDAAVSVTLESLSGSASLVENTTYFWRVAANDTHDAWSAWSQGPSYFVYGSDATAPTCSVLQPVGGATLTSIPITISGSASDDLSGPDLVEVSTDGGLSWTPATGRDAWFLSWSPELGGDYDLRCRARDVAGNQGGSSGPDMVHVDLSRTVGFAVDGASVVESAGSAAVTLVMSGPRAVPVTVGVSVTGGDAVPGTDYTVPPETIVFAPGQTVAVLPLMINDDPQAEPTETVELSLHDSSPSDVTLGTVHDFTLHILNDDSPADLNLDGLVDGTDMVDLVLELFDLDGTLAGDAQGGAHVGSTGYDLDKDDRVLCSDVAQEIKIMLEPTGVAQ